MCHVCRVLAFWTAERVKDAALDEETALDDETAPEERHEWE